MPQWILGVASAALSVVLMSYTAHAQTADHLKCYKIKDPVKLKGIVDITTPQFPPELGCKVSKAKMFCVPARVTRGVMPVPRIMARTMVQ